MSVGTGGGSVSVGRGVALGRAGGKVKVAVAGWALCVWTTSVSIKSCMAVWVRSGVGNTNGVGGEANGRLQAAALRMTQVAANKISVGLGFIFPSILLNKVETKDHGLSR